MRLSHRVYVTNSRGEDLQVFGNNGCTLDFVETLNRQGAGIDVDGEWYLEDFEVEDVQSLVDSVERYIRESRESFDEYWSDESNVRIEKELYSKDKPRSFFDLTNDFEAKSYDGERDAGFLSFLPYHGAVAMVVWSDVLFQSYNLVRHLRDAGDVEVSMGYSKIRLVEGRKVLVSMG